MTSPRWSDRHDELVRGSAPEVPAVSADDLHRAWRVVEAQVAVEDVPRRSWGLRLRWGVAIGLGAVLLGTGGLAAADLLSASTGEGPVDGEDRLLGGPGERLRLAAPDFADVVRAETADIPFPDQRFRDIAVGHQARDARGTSSTDRVSAGAIRAWVADAALCTWVNQWAVATREGNAAERSEAIAMIAAAPRWAAVVAIDPSPFSRVEQVETVMPNGRVRTEEYVDDSQFFYLAALGRAVAGADLAGAAELLADHNGQCRPDLLPDFPAALSAASRPSDALSEGR